MIITFYFIKENNLEKNATAASTLATSSILQHIKISKTKAEVITLTLASVIEKGFKNNKGNDDIITSILDTDKENSINIVSGGVWFEPYSIAKNTKDPMSFYTRNSHNKFELVDNYLTENTTNYREMEFYKIARQIKSGDVEWTNVYIDPVTHIKMITVVSPIYKNDTFIGTASIDIKIDDQIKALSSIESQNMYLMMTDKEGNFIGKSTNLNTHIKQNNIYRLNNPQLKEIIQRIKPILTHTIKHTNINNDILSKIYFFEEDPILYDQSVVAVYHFPRTNWNIIIGIPEDQVMAQSNQTFKRVLTIVVILTILATIVGYLLLQKLFVSPIESINKQLKNHVAKDGQDYKLLEYNDKGEIGLLVDNLNARTLALDESKRREAKEIEKRLYHEKMLLQQSKMAAMGEMMDAVAHQWKQPLNALSMYSEIIKSDFEDEIVDQKYIDQFKDDMQVPVSYTHLTLPTICSV